MKIVFRIYIDGKEVKPSSAPPLVVLIDNGSEYEIWGRVKK